MERALDLGCGCGVIAISLAYQKDITMDALDISEAAADLTRRNVALNGLDGRVTVTCGDLRRHRELFQAGAYDLVVTNPPYFPGGSGKSAKTEAIALARDERECALADIVEARPTHPLGRELCPCVPSGAPFRALLYDDRGGY